jgi:hypothetical protein
MRSHWVITAPVADPFATITLIDSVGQAGAVMAPVDGGSSGAASVPPQEKFWPAGISNSPFVPAVAGWPNATYIDTPDSV